MGSEPVSSAIPVLCFDYWELVMLRVGNIPVCVYVPSGRKNIHVHLYIAFCGGLGHQHSKGADGSRYQSICEPTEPSQPMMSDNVKWTKIGHNTGNYVPYVNGEEYKRIYERSYIWTVEKDKKTWLLIAAFYTTWAALRFNPNSGLNGILIFHSCVYKCDDVSISFSAVQIWDLSYINLQYNLVSTIQNIAR